jgi:hypothetical protein
MRHTLLTAVLLVTACSTEDEHLGGKYPVGPGPDSGAGSGGAAGSGGEAGSGGTAGSGGSGGGSQGSGGNSDSGTQPTMETHFALVEQQILQAGRCLPNPLNVDQLGQVPCAVVQVSPASDCGCTRPGFRPPNESLVATARKRMQDIGACGGAGQPSCESVCMCEMEQASGEALSACRSSAPMAVDGWCYVDEFTDPSDVALLDVCPRSQRHRLRFKNETTEAGPFTMIACGSWFYNGAISPDRSGAVGDTCIPGLEKDQEFSGFGPAEVAVELGSRQCASGVCLVNHFQGRVSCPYGQADATQPYCTVPEYDVPVLKAVAPQLVDRRGDGAVYCSCRCAGPGPGPFCTCPESYACTPLIDNLGVSSSDVVGSYCIKQGTEYDGLGGIECSRAAANCE